MTKEFPNYKWHYSTPEGFDDLLLLSDGKVLTGLWFVGSHNEGKYTINSKEKDILVFRDICRWLDIYFSGQQPNFTPTYRIDDLTPFRKKVSETMCTIPFGKTITYGEIAKRLKTNSAQAVGGAVGWNPICIIIPCHRVVGANGNLTGYGGGMHNKIALLKLEGHDMRQFTIPAKEKRL